MFDPTLAPNRGDDNFNNYGEEQIKIISEHFYGEAQEDQTQLTAEWKQVRYHFEKMKETSQYLESTTPTEYCLRHILQLTTPFGQSFPLLSKVAEIILSIPITMHDQRERERGQCIETHQNQTKK
ncbi:hypothetical protein FSP39_018113 [Pinctada imbricata]|uniref:HAT C-terminal dimerisation domain-containing protein n=1 Tax=Pinctada imbricata TaxID=66713 RepID=A0AA89C4R3_PINIB|nr:hypothetical protein FSP39_018113 [Pinctada imbricata]